MTKKFLPCISGILVVLLSFVFWMELGNPDKIELSLIFFRNGIQLGYTQLIFVVLLGYSLVILINILSYHGIVQQRMQYKLEKTTIFSLVVIFKYLIPFLFLYCVTIDGQTLTHGLKTTNFIILLLTTLSLMLDWVVFYHRFKHGPNFTFSFNDWEIKVSIKALYTTMAVAIWGFAMTIFIWRIARKIADKNRQQPLPENKSCHTLPLASDRERQPHAAEIEIHLESQTTTIYLLEEAYDCLERRRIEVLNYVGVPNWVWAEDKTGLRL